MKIIRFMVLSLFLAFAIPAITNAESTPIPAELRQGVPHDSASIATALALKHAGWTYIMPQPKSPQAAWGNYDGRTTWWVGYWTNGRENSTSSIQPTKNGQGKYVGDGKGGRMWRRGGTPPAPTIVEWLCSEAGGPQP